jgi:hypothetical protein
MSPVAALLIFITAFMMIGSVAIGIRRWPDRNTAAYGGTLPFLIHVVCLFSYGVLLLSFAFVPRNVAMLAVVIAVVIDFTAGTLGRRRHRSGSGV